MTEENGRKVRKKQLSHQEFFKLCRVLEQFGEEFKKEQITHVKAMHQLTNACGFKVSDYAFREARKAAGIDWHQKRRHGDGGDPHRRAFAKSRFLAEEVLRIQKELGMTIDPRLEKMADWGSCAHLEKPSLPLEVTDMDKAQKAFSKVSIRPTEMVPISVSGGKA